MQPSGPALVSGEGVQLALAPAGVGSRVVAAALDAAIQFVALFLVALIDAVFAGGADAAAFQAAVIIEAVLVLAGYPIIAEWLGRGRTVGKLVFGLRVVRDDGAPIGFRQALVRGLAGFVLEKPGLAFPLTTIAGLLTMSASTREKRIGDMLAGTIVVNENSGVPPLAPLPHWVPTPLQAWVLSLDMHRLDDRLALHVRQFVSRAGQMSAAAQYALGESLRRRVLMVTAPPPPANTPTPALLLSVLAERRRRAAHSSPPASGVPAPSSPAPTRLDPGPPTPPVPDSPFAPPG